MRMWEERVHVCVHVPVQSRVGVSLQSLPTLVVMLYNSVAFSPRGVYAHTLSLSPYGLPYSTCLPACLPVQSVVYVCACVYVCTCDSANCAKLQD